MAQHITTSPTQTANLGKRLAAILRGGEIIAFTGGMGVGKTTFCKGLAQGLHTLDPVSSPTFAIVNYYRGSLPLAHFDAYRITSADDLEAAGFYEYRAAGAVVAVEWSENISDLLEEPVILVAIQTLPGNERNITITGTKEASEL